MKKMIPLSLMALSILASANEVELAPIGVEASILSEVSQKAKVSADLAEALERTIPSIDMSRRSGIANDIFIRGQKRDNISIEVDGTKVCGACPNRMDPPVSHVLANQIQEVEVIEGPYDVETFGTMSGGLKITTKQPSAKEQGELNFGFGSWGYRKVGTTLSGGNEYVRVLLSASTERGDQYEDGDGNTLAEQRANYGFTPPATMTNQDSRYASDYEDMAAYKKRSVNAKMFVNVTQDQELQLSFTQNKSDDILYANTPMDAVYDYSNIYSVAYDIKNLTEFYKNINLQYYYSDVDHPMSTEYRNSGTVNYATNQLQTSMQGVKLKNNFDFDGLKVLLGIDSSKRTWEGEFYMTNVASGVITPNHTRDSALTETKNNAIFTKLEQSFGALDIELGARYDDTSIQTIHQPAQDYTGVNANLMTTFNITKENKVFLGFGQANRVPDARELSFNSSNELDQVTNQEVDLGYELSSDLIHFKIKGFYSMLSDYIYLTPAKTFENLDATIYGGELSASIYPTDSLTIDMGASYKVGEKDEVTATQTDKYLADIAPLRGNIGVSYEYMSDSVVSLDVQYSDAWENFDEANGEQAIDSWTTLNAKIKHAFNQHVDFTLGVNNLTDETYAQSNTYTDLTLVTIAPTADKMLLNEPGRYVYTNLDIKF